MSRITPSENVEIDFEQSAREYLSRLPLEHFMESTEQATQRKIFVVALDLVHFRRPDVQPFSELLVQWLRKGRRKLGQVVPDNMVVLWHEPIVAHGSYDLQRQPTGPFWVLEYVSKNNKRKDYEDNFDKYEELTVPYYLTFYPDAQELTLYHHNGKKYVALAPDAQGRLAIAELEMELALLEGWVRFWFRGELLPLPAEMQQRLDQFQLRTNELEQRADVLQQDLDRERQARQNLEEELRRLRAQLGQTGNT